MEFVAASTAIMYSHLHFPVFSPNRSLSRRISILPVASKNEPDNTNLVPILNKTVSLSPLSKDAAMGLVLSAATGRGWTTGSGMEPNRYVLLGNHRDAWTYGAVDPNNGTAVLLDIARRLGILLRLGWTPRRSIILCSWDVEEFGMIGSTEWVEQNLEILKSKAVAYLNVDCAVQGHGFFAGATPQLDALLVEIMKKINDSDSGGMIIYQSWVATNAGISIGRLSGVESDFVAFFQHVGVPSVDLYYGKGIKACMEAKHPVQEEPYEISCDIYGCCNGPQNGRMGITEKAPKLFGGINFYLAGVFESSYKGYLEDLIVAAGGLVLENKADISKTEANRAVVLPSQLIGNLGFCLKYKGKPLRTRNFIDFLNMLVESLRVAQNILSIPSIENAATPIHLFMLKFQHVLHVDSRAQLLHAFVNGAFTGSAQGGHVLRMEQDVVKFIRDPTQEQLEFQHLPTSYLRLAAHRLAQHYYLQSVVVSDPTLPDGSGSKILIRKTTECRLPLVRLADIPVNLPPEDSNNAMKFAIKQRPQKRSQTANHSNANSSRMNLVKSVEERKEEYNRARARIFSSSSDGGGISWRKPEGGDSVTVPESLPQSYPFPSPRLEEKPSFEGPEVDLGIRGLGDSSSTSSSSSRSARSKAEKEPAITRYRPNNKVAIFRDREVDQKDPDYDRSYDRYMQRFDPGFGFNGGPYTMQPLYSPAVNYNTEFPQLATVSHRPPQMSPLEHQPRPLPPHHLRGPWTVTSNPPTAIGYGPPESMMPPPPPFNPSHVGAHSTSAIYHLHSSHYACPRPGMGFVHPHERAHQPFAQRHQQQPEMNFGIARPR